MQTFLCDPSFKTTASLLDSKRLNKQRLECLQIYHAIGGLRFDTITDDIIGPANGWKLHPATKMWQRTPGMLLLYSWHVSEECNRRDIKDHRGLQYFFERRMSRHPFITPDWWTNPQKRDRVIYTHQCNLIRKDAEFYKNKFPDVSIAEAFTTDYFWPLPS